MAEVGAQLEDGLAVRPPQQSRSRAKWGRILDAGVALLEEVGTEGFTIAAVCERADVPPGAIYARTASKEALFLAVYEHGMAALRAEQAVLLDVQRWGRLDAGARIRLGIVEVAALFAHHAPFLRAVVLVSSSHPQVARRGRAYAAELTDAFTVMVLGGVPDATPADAEEVRLSFSTVFAALVMHTAYGKTFDHVGVDEATFVRHLGDLVADHLLPPTASTASVP